jgi:ribonuclease Z
VTPEYLAMIDDIPRAYLPSRITNPRILLNDLVNGYRITLTNGDIIEPPPPSSSGTKIVVLGDTSDASKVEPLAHDASLLIHESTNAYIPPSLQLDSRIISKTPQMIRDKAISRGHSTPDMAGAFARRINAKRLFLNHFSAK